MTLFDYGAIGVLIALALWAGDSITSSASANNHHDDR
jgi:hypothetical protein